MELLATSLPSTCQPGAQQIGGIVLVDAILVEVETLPNGCKIERSFTIDQLQALLVPYVPPGYQDGDPILNTTWEALKAANPEDGPLGRFCDGMIRAGKGEAWTPLVIRPTAPAE